MGFIYKKPQGSKPQKTLSGSYQNNISKDKEVMNNKISVVEDIITDTPRELKRIRVLLNVQNLQKQSLLRKIKNS